MTWPASFFFPDRVRIRDVVGGGGMGRRIADAPGRADVPAEVKDEQQLVRDANGQEVVSSAQVTVPLTDPVRLGALVTVWPGTGQEREAEVIAIARNQNPRPLQSFLLLSLK